MAYLHVKCAILCLMISHISTNQQTGSATAVAKSDRTNSHDYVVQKPANSYSPGTSVTSYGSPSVPAKLPYSTLTSPIYDSNHQSAPVYNKYKITSPSNNSPSPPISYQASPPAYASVPISPSYTQTYNKNPLVYNSQESASAQTYKTPQISSPYSPIQQSPLKYGTYNTSPVPYSAQQHPNLYNNKATQPQGQSVYNSPVQTHSVSYNSHESSAPYNQQITRPVYNSSPKKSAYNPITTPYSAAAAPSYTPSYSSSGVAPYYVHHTRYSKPYAQSYNNFVPIHHFNHYIKPGSGQYDVEFETGNGVRQQESGFLKTIPMRNSYGYSGYNNNNNNNNNYQQSGISNVKTGSVSWTSPEGLPFSFSYIADENGYRPILHSGPVRTEYASSYGYGYNNNQAYNTNYEVAAPSQYIPSIYSSSISQTKI